MLNYEIISELYSHIATDMERSSHDVIGAIARIFTWKKRVSRLRFSQMLLEMWRCGGGWEGPEASTDRFIYRRGKQVKKTPGQSPDTYQDTMFSGWCLKQRLLEQETDAQLFPLHILGFFSQLYRASWYCQISLFIQLLHNYIALKECKYLH